MNRGEDLYAILGLRQGAAVGDVKRAYRDLALKCHPDRNPLGAAAFQRISTAYEVLGDEQKRRAYDAQCSIQQRMQHGGSAMPANGRPQSAHTAASARSMWSGTWKQPTGDPKHSWGSTGAGTRPQSASYRPPGTFTADYTSSTGGFQSPQSTPSTAAPDRAAPPPPHAPSESMRQTKASGSPVEPDNAESIEADRLRAQGLKRTPSVSAYNISAADREHLQSVKERFEAAMDVDMNAWERIRRRPTTAGASRTTEPVSQAAPPASLPHTTAPDPAAAARPATAAPRPSSARPFPRAFVPPAPSQPEKDFEALKKCASTSDILGRASSSAGNPASPPPAATPLQPNDVPPGSNAQRPTPARPFSAGVHRFHPAGATTAPHAPPASCSTTNGKEERAVAPTDAFLVPSDKEISEMSNAELKRITEVLERKMRIVRQAALIRSLSDETPKV
jgi:hypothetical protein